MRDSIDSTVKPRWRRRRRPMARPQVYVLLAGLGALAWLSTASLGQQAPVIGFTVPTDVTVSSTNPTQGQLQADFDFFSWQSFVALNWPANPQQRGFPNTAATIGGPGPVVWETFNEKYEVFQPGDPPPPPPPFNNPQQLPASCSATSGVKVLRMAGKVSAEALSVDVLDEFLQALAGPLVDTQGNFARYEIRLNLGEWTYINSASLYNSQLQDAAAPINFPSTDTDALTTQAIEVKAAWKVLTPAEIQSNTFYVSQAFIYDAATQQCSGPTAMGLVGLHISHKTASQSNWIWSTFEHVANAPTVPPGTTPPSTGTYNFFNPQCALNGAACTTNCVPAQYSSLANGALVCPTGQPNSQVVRVVPIPDGTGTMPDGSPAPNTQALNAQWQAALAGTVWANYQLVSTQWTFPPAPPGTIIPSQLTNTTMETYFQGQAFGSCIFCHRIARTASGQNSADMSYLLASAYPQQGSVPEAPDRSELLRFAGQASDVGRGTGNGTVRVTGSAKFKEDINLGGAVIAIRSLLHEEGGGGELIAEADGAKLLPRSLTSRAGSDATAAIFETPPGSLPKLKVEVRKRIRGRRVVAFSISADHVAILKEPALCASSAITTLRTRFTLVDGTHAPVTVTAEWPWRCRGDRLTTK